MKQDFIVCGRFEEVLPKIPSETVDLLFTSPPYGVGKDYEPDARFGVLLQLLNNCFREAHRVLKRGGYAVFNFGDMIPGRDMLGTDEPSEMPMGWIYWSQGLANGFVLQAQRVWQKDFSKITGGKHAISAPRAVPEFEHLYTFRKPGGGPQVIRERKLSQRAIWSTVGEGSMKVNHPAAFPQGLVQRVLTVYTDPGDVVLDPFAGSGTVGLVARQMGRRFVLVEKEPAYCEEIKERLGDLSDHVPADMRTEDEILSMFES